MVLYRQHRGWLDDSMGTVREVASIDDIRVIEADRAEWGEDLTQIEVRPYGYDKRIEWDTHIVTVSGRIVGFTNGPLP